MMTTMEGSLVGPARVLHWKFPLPRTHCGVLLGNGLQGLMVWGDRRLHITVGRAGFWDHRHGNAFSSRTTWADVRRMVEAGDEAGLLEAFSVDGQIDSELGRPHQIGGGRVEIEFPDGWIPNAADLDLLSGTLVIHLGNALFPDQMLSCTVRQAVSEELAWVDLPPKLADRTRIHLIPSWDHTHETLKAMGVAEPVRRDVDDEHGRLRAFEQALPEDAGLGMACLLGKDRLTIATALGQEGPTDEVKGKAGAEAVASPLERAIGQCRRGVSIAMTDRQRAYFADYWSAVPEIELPDPELQHIVDYGLHKMAGLTPPHGPAATLQGPWLEEYQLPPWSCDYHFNINIQMIYWPCLAAGRFDHFHPLWAMIKRWWPTLADSGSRFFGREGAIMLPHAVDDRCQVVGTFWTGTIDHACTAWMAQMAWLHYRYSMDEQVLRDVAWPMLCGALEGYWAMLEPVTDEHGQARLALPVSVSPEYRGRSIDAAGRNACFQLAAIHATVNMLRQAADILGEPTDPRWDQISEQLPPYTLVEGPRRRELPSVTEQRIGLWEGMDLEDSHRHHSHLASIYPFMTIDPDDPAHRDIVEQSIYHWVRTGMGAWSGWAVPWASILHARCSNADGAVALLHHWKRHFTNEGHGTLHDGMCLGVTTLAPGLRRKDRLHAAEREVMQIEAGMGALNAVFELLLQDRHDGLHVVPNVPTGWKKARFRRLAAPGGFNISADIEQGRVCRVEVFSRLGGSLILHHGLGEQYLQNGTAHSGKSVELTLQPNQTIDLESIPDPTP